MAKAQAFWVVDSYGQESLHTNGSNLSYEQSYLGHVVRRDTEWFFVDKKKKEHGPFDTYAASKREGMKICGVEYL